MLFSNSDGQAWLTASKYDANISHSKEVRRKADERSISEEQDQQNSSSVNTKYKGTSERHIGQSPNDERLTNRRELRGGNVTIEKCPAETIAQCHRKPVAKQSQLKSDLPQDTRKQSRCSFRYRSTGLQSNMRTTPYRYSSTTGDYNDELNADSDDEYTDQETSAVIGYRSVSFKGRSAEREPASKSSAYSITTAYSEEEGGCIGRADSDDCFVYGDNANHLIPTVLAELDCSCIRKTSKIAHGSYGGDQSGASTCKSKYSRANLLLFYLKHAHTLKDDKDEVIIDLSSRKTFLEKSITSALMDSFSQIY
ncbi:uncharacterized protein LOC111249419 isoform X2 [Varroa destructor]|uniref:Uncharacterized protein n=1 Tax=Varroa destructor TaxID=109461 RepID=A0A7M7JYR4_VARDE|nr:uncharacterized protein LOC111249419 isoform X2 [Varroa destructor]